MPSHALQSLPAAVVDALDRAAAQFREIEQKMNDPAVLSDHRAVRDLSIKRAALEPLVRSYTALKLGAEMDELRRVVDDGSDADLAALARGELPELEQRAEVLVGQVGLLVTSEDRNVGSVMLEVRAGTGGDEAALWARDLWEMYARLAARKNWTFEIMDIVPETDAGGLRSAIASIRGEGVWSLLAYEAGVHSVKRVPATEAQGRVHTSTATIAVLPEPEEVQVKIDWANDVTEHLTTAQGPGGQNVNKVTTACQLIHKLSGIEVRMQESKSLQQNREKARRLLLTRLYELERRKQHEARSAARRGQIGSGERSEKVRTYRYKEGIVADERLPGEYPLRNVLAGDLDALLNDLVELETTRRLREL